MQRQQREERPTTHRHSHHKQRSDRTRSRSRSRERSHKDTHQDYQNPSKKLPKKSKFDDPNPQKFENSNFAMAAPRKPTKNYGYTDMRSQDPHHHVHNEGKFDRKERPEKKSRWGEENMSRAHQHPNLNYSLNEIISGRGQMEGSSGGIGRESVYNINISNDMNVNINLNDMISFNSPNACRRKIYIPDNPSINYAGLIIGPQGLDQKRLEEETHCKIQIRGKGSHKEGMPPQPDDDEDCHVLVLAQDEESADMAESRIKDIIFASEQTRNNIRAQQLENAKNINTTKYGRAMDESLLTPYGPPDPNAYIIPVPNDCVGLIIGKGGETIRFLQQESGAKVQVAKKEVAETGLRNVFVRGSPEKYLQAKRMIEGIVEEHRNNLKVKLDVNVITEEFPIQTQFTGAIIGKGGETLRALKDKTGAQLTIPREFNQNTGEKMLSIKGTPDQIREMKSEIINLIRNTNANNKSLGVNRTMEKSLEFLHSAMGMFQGAQNLTSMPVMEPSPSFHRSKENEEEKDNRHSKTTRKESTENKSEDNPEFDPNTPQTLQAAAFYHQLCPVDNLYMQYFQAPQATQAASDQNDAPRRRKNRRRKKEDQSNQEQKAEENKNPIS